MKDIDTIFSLDGLKKDLIKKKKITSIFEDLPVNVEKITEIYGIIIDDSFKAKYASNVGIIDGLKIWVNPNDANEFPALRRHIIAHGLGHIILHKPKAGDTIHFEESLQTIRGDDFICGNYVGWSKEKDCNSFAAKLLIPEDKLMDSTRRLTNKSGGEIKPKELFTKISIEFNVPKSLAERRVLLYAEKE